MYKNIIVPIDMSQEERAQKALALAQKLVDKGGTLHLVKVIEDIPSYVAAELPAEVFKNSSDRATAYLEGLAKTVDGEVKVEVRHGRAANEILSAAEEAGADLIIVASHRPDMSDYLLGSTASRVVRHAKCPVLVDR